MTTEGVRFVNVIFQNQLFEERITKLEKDFHSKFSSLSDLVDSIESSFQEAINNLNSDELDIRLSILEAQNRLRYYKEELNEIDEDAKASEEAADWLDIHRQELIHYAKESTFDTHLNELKKFAGIQVSVEKIQLFCRDLDFYLRWIGHYLKMCTPPDRMPKGVIVLVLPPEIYLDAFKLISSNRISTSFGLSENAVIMLKSSIYRFLIKRDLKQDASPTV